MLKVISAYFKDFLKLEAYQQKVQIASVVVCSYELWLQQSHHTLRTSDEVVENARCCLPEKREEAEVSN